MCKVAVKCPTTTTTTTTTEKPKATTAHPVDTHNIFFSSCSFGFAKDVNGKCKEIVDFYWKINLKKVCCFDV